MTIMDRDEETTGQTMELLATCQPAVGEAGAYERVLGDAMDGDSSLFARKTTDAGDERSPRS